MKRLSTQPGAGLCYYNARAATANPLLVPRHPSVQCAHRQTRVVGPPENAQTFQYTGRAQRSPSAAQEWKLSFRYPQKVCGSGFGTIPSAVRTFPCAPAEPCTGRCVPSPARLESPGGERQDSIDREKRRGLFMGIKNAAPCHFPKEGLKAQGVRPSSNR